MPLFAIVIVTLITRSSSLPSARQAGPVEMPLTNGGFEGGSHSMNAYWTPEGGPYHTKFSEVAPPEGWTAWWREGFNVSAHLTGIQGGQRCG